MSVKLWLQSINLDQYHSDFVRAGYTTVEQCQALTDENLQEIGITLPGHKKRILAYLPNVDEFRAMDSDHLYGNVPLPLPPSAPEKCVKRASGSVGASAHTYVNTKSVTSDSMHRNVHSSPDSKDKDRTPVSLHTIIGDTDKKDDSESFYDLLPPPCQVPSAKADFDPGDYVNIAPPLEGAVGGVDLPPMLPPKKNKGNRRSIDEIMGIVPTLEDTTKRPVPKPRTTVRSRSSLDPSERSPRNSTVPSDATSARASPPVMKPTPKPRPRPTPRGRKPHSKMDSASPSSSGSGSPRHSNASPVSLPSPLPRDNSPDMPKERAPSAPILQHHNQPVKRLSLETESPIKETVSPSVQPPLWERGLSMETEVPPAVSPEPCGPIKIPIPPTCSEQNNNSKTSDLDIKVESEETSWKENEIYEGAENPKGYTDPEEPEKLEDFIKSLLPETDKSQSDTTAQDTSDTIQKDLEEPVNDEIYQVILF